MRVSPIALPPGWREDMTTPFVVVSPPQSTWGGAT
jgi:hypothetical protein